MISSSSPHHDNISNTTEDGYAVEQLSANEMVML